MWVNPQSSRTGDGLLFALRETEGRYRLYPIYSHWNFLTGDDFVWEISDYNQNGTAEIIFYREAHSGSMCAGQLLVLEWDGRRFIDLSKGVFYNDQCGLLPCFCGTDANGFATVSVDNPDNGRYETYGWNGTFYEMVGYEYKGPAEEVFDHLLEDGDYDQAAGLVPKLATNRCNILFQSGMVAALKADIEQATTIFESLVITPTMPVVPVIAPAAQAFLDHYQGKADVYRACEAALVVMENAITPYQDENGRVPDDKRKEVWGFTDALLCSLPAAFRFLADTQSIQEAADPIAALRAAGVTIHRSAKIDIDLDGIPDWVLILDRPGWKPGRPARDVWALQSTAGGRQAHRLDSWDFFSPEEAQNPTSRIELVSPISLAKPVLLVQVGEFLTIFPVVSGAGIGDEIYRNPGIRQFSTTAGAETVGIELWYNLAEWYDPWVFYRWDARTGSIDDVNLLEEMIFTDNNPAGALALVSKVLNESKRGYDPETQPYYLYLLALAYELTGDEPNAVQTYWQLWHDYPASPYALMARAKLEPGAP